MRGFGIDLSDLRWDTFSWLFDHRSVITGIVAVMMVCAILGAVAADVLTDPLVELESGTGKLVGVVTSDGVHHPPSYFFEKNVEEYDVMWVPPHYDN